MNLPRKILLRRNLQKNRLKRLKNQLQLVKSRQKLRRLSLSKISDISAPALLSSTLDRLRSLTFSLSSSLRGKENRRIPKMNPFLPWMKTTAFQTKKRLTITVSSSTIPRTLCTTGWRLATTRKDTRCRMHPTTKRANIIGNWLLKDVKRRKNRRKLAQIEDQSLCQEWIILTNIRTMCPNHSTSLKSMSLQLCL